jgi:hypothetical protein
MFKQILGIIVTVISGIGLVLSGLGSGLGLLFVGLKLIGIIDWSWWYVTLPFSVPLVSMIFYILGMILLEQPKTRKRR